MAGKIRKFTQSEFVRNVFTLSFGAGIAGIFPVLVSPLLVKFYTPEHFGQLAVFISIYAVMGTIASGRYELAVILPKKDLKSHQLLFLSVVLASATALVVLAILLIFKNPIATFFELEGIGNLIYLLPSAIWVIAVYKSFFYLNNRYKQYRIMASSKVIQNGSVGLGQLGLGALSFASVGLIVGRFFGILMGLLSLMRSNWTRLSESLKETSWSDLKAVAKEYAHFPKHLILSHGMSSLYQQVPVVFITRFFNSANAGFYSLAQQILAIPNVLISRAMGDVFRQRATEIYNEHGKFEKLLLKTTRTTLLFSIIPFGLFFWLAPDLFVWVYGEEWATSGDFSRILIIGLFFSFIITPIDKTSIIVGNTKYLLAWTTSYLIGHALIIGLTMYFLWSVEMYLVLLVIIRIIHYVADFFFCWQFSKGRWIQKNNSSEPVYTE